MKLKSVTTIHSTDPGKIDPSAKKKSARELFEQIKDGDYTGLQIESESNNDWSKSICFFDEAGRYIDYTRCYDFFDDSELQIYPSYQYFENYLLDENKGSKIERYSPKDYKLTIN